MIRDNYAHVRFSASVRCDRLRASGKPVRGAVARMTTLSLEETARQNAYLKLRNAQLESDLRDVSAEAERLRQIVERLYGRAPRIPDSQSS